MQHLQTLVPVSVEHKWPTPYGPLWQVATHLAMTQLHIASGDCNLNLWLKICTRSASLPILHLKLQTEVITWHLFLPLWKERENKAPESKSTKFKSQVQKKNQSHAFLILPFGAHAFYSCCFTCSLPNFIRLQAGMTWAKQYNGEAWWAEFAPPPAPHKNHLPSGREEDREAGGQRQCQGLLQSEYSLLSTTPGPSVL